jgi:hypothetical protein
MNERKEAHCFRKHASSFTHHHHHNLVSIFDQHQICAVRCGHTNNDDVSQYRWIEMVAWRQLIGRFQQRPSQINNDATFPFSR